MNPKPDSDCQWLQAWYKLAARVTDKGALCPVSGLGIVHKLLPLLAGTEAQKQLTGSDNGDVLQAVLFQDPAVYDHGNSSKRSNYSVKCYAGTIQSPILYITHITLYFVL